MSEKKQKPTKNRQLPPVSIATGGVRPRIDLSDGAALQDIDDRDYARFKNLKWREPG